MSDDLIQSIILNMELDTATLETMEEELLCSLLIAPGISTFLLGEPLKMLG